METGVDLRGQQTSGQTRVVVVGASRVVLRRGKGKAMEGKVTKIEGWTGGGSKILLIANEGVTDT